MAHPPYPPQLFAMAWEGSGPVLTDGAGDGTDGCLALFSAAHPSGETPTPALAVLAE
jgi:hypothetical protein